MPDRLVKEVDGTSLILLETGDGILLEVGNPAGFQQVTIEVAEELDTTNCEIEVAFEYDTALDVTAASQINPGFLGDFLQEADGVSHFTLEDGSGILLLETGPFIRLTAADIAAESDFAFDVIAASSAGTINANTLTVG